MARQAFYPTIKKDLKQHTSCFFPPMGSSAQNSSSVHWCRRRVRFNEVPEKVSEKVAGGFGAEPGQVQQDLRAFNSGEPSWGFPALGFAARFRKICKKKHKKTLRLWGVPPKLIFKIDTHYVALRFPDCRSRLRFALRQHRTSNSGRFQPRLAIIFQWGYRWIATPASTRFCRVLTGLWRRFGCAYDVWHKPGQLEFSEIPMATFDIFWTWETSQSRRERAFEPADGVFVQIAVMGLYYGMIWHDVATLWWTNIAMENGHL